MNERSPIFESSCIFCVFLNILESQFITIIIIAIVGDNGTSIVRKYSKMRVTLLDPLHRQWLEQVVYNHIYHLII